MYDKLFRVLRAPEGGDGDGGAAPPAVDPPTTDKNTPDPELVKAKAELDKLKAEKEAAAKAAAEAKGDKTKDELEQQRSELEKVRAEIQKLRGDALAEARSGAFERLGILPEYRDLVPGDMDPRTAEGATELEKWLAERPALTRSRVPQPPKLSMDGWHPKAKEAIEKGNNPLINRRSLEKMEEHRRSHRQR